MFNTGLWQALSTLLESLLPVLERPAIQRQLATIALIVFVAWATPLATTRLYRLFREHFVDNERKGNARRALADRLNRALSQTYSPLVGIGLSIASIQFFDSQDWLAGLLTQMQGFFFLLLLYRVIVAGFFLLLDEHRATTYHSKLLKPIFFIAIAVGVNQLLSGIVSFADQRVLTIAERDLTIGSLFIAGVVFYLFMIASWLIRDILTYLILPRLKTEAGLANTILTVSQYVVITIGILSALAMLGIDLSTLAIIGAGLSVGIGFGLQELVANFISGILLLFEQSIRPGDVIEISNNIGTVEKLRIRSTTIRTRDNIEVIVPNQSLLTAAVTTYTHSERLVRLNITVGVSYNSKPTDVRDALLAAGGKHGLVRKRPEPTVFFEGFGDSSLDFALAVWIENAELIRTVSSDLRFIIWEELSKRNIEIPFPQRDLHIRSGIPWDALTESPDAPEPEVDEPDERPAKAKVSPLPKPKNVKISK